MERILKSTFSYKGYKCAIVEINDNHDLGFFQFSYPNKYYCGYVLVPRYHSYYEKDYNDIEINCHGGLTYSSHSLLETEYPGWWIGFDCAHGGDTIEECDLEYCINECRNIVDQIREME